jgi:hypothetical protein
MENVPRVGIRRFNRFSLKRISMWGPSLRNCNPLGWRDVASESLSVQRGKSDLEKIIWIGAET